MDKLLTPKQVKGILSPMCNEEVVNASWNDVRYLENGKFTSQKREFFMTDNSLRQLLSEIGMSKGTFSRVSDVLRKNLVEELLNDKAPLGILIDRDTGNAKQFIKTDVPYLNAMSVFNRAIGVLEKNKLMLPTDSNIQADVSPSGEILLNFVTNQSTTIKKVGDIVSAGVSILTGINDMIPKLQMGMFAYTLQCTNGLVHEFTDYNVVRAGSIDEVYKILDANILKLYEETKTNLIPHLEKLTEVTVEDPTRLVHQISRENRLGSLVTKTLINRIPSLGKNPTMYQLVNMITNLANSFDLDTRIKMQSLGGRLVKVECRCPTCRSLL